MKILELNIKNFGKFHQRQFLFRDGIHIICGENEFGKSTIYGFVKAMLFGMERGRGRAAGKDEYSRFEPWENPAYYGGVLRFESGGKVFRLERDFSKHHKRASLICEEDGEELSVEDGDLTMLLEEMSSTDFENTIAVGQLAVETGQTLTEALRNYAANYSATGDSDLNLKGACDTIHKRIKQVDKEEKEQSRLREAKRGKLQQERKYLLEDIQRIRREQVRESEGSKSSGTYWTLAVMAVIIAVACVTLPQPWNRWFGAGLAVVTALWEVRLIVYRKSVQAGESAKREYLDMERREKEVQCQNVEEALEEMQEPDETIQRLQKRRKALALAMEQLQNISAEMTQDFGKRFRERASEILEQITDGKYKRLILDGERIYLYDGQRRVLMEQVSRGTIEQAYFSLRMAAADVLYREKFPLILDETFAFYDENRLKSALKWLSNQPRQVIILTCQRRETEVLEELC